MADHKTDGVSRDRVIAVLLELIDALDRRVPHVERAGEIAIALTRRLSRRGLWRESTNSNVRAPDRETRMEYIDNFALYRFYKETRVDIDRHRPVFKRPRASVLTVVSSGTRPRNGECRWLAEHRRDRAS
jgi:hypothetical protein